MRTGAPPRLADTFDLTRGKVRNELAGRGIPVSYVSVWRMVRRLGLRHKKRSIFAIEQHRLDVAIARDVWRAALAGFDFASLVFVDETGTTTSMTRLRGWDQGANRFWARPRTVTRWRPLSLLVWRTTASVPRCSSTHR